MSGRRGDDTRPFVARDHAVALHEEFGGPDAHPTYIDWDDIIRRPYLRSIDAVRLEIPRLLLCAVEESDAVIGLGGIAESVLVE